MSPQLVCSSLQTCVPTSPRDPCLGLGPRSFPRPCLPPVSGSHPNMGNRKGTSRRKKRSRIRVQDGHAPSISRASSGPTSSQRTTRAQRGSGTCPRPHSTSASSHRSRLLGLPGAGGLGRPETARPCFPVLSGERARPASRLLPGSAPPPGSRPQGPSRPGEQTHWLMPSSHLPLYCGCIHGGPHFDHLTIARVDAGP